MKVAMQLTNTDVQNAEGILRMTGARNKAHAVSIALSITNFLLERKKEGADVLFRFEDGSLAEVLLEGVS